MRKFSRVDHNQPEIVAALRQMGASVQHIHTIGDGCPDLLVGYRGVNLLFEVKIDGGKLNELELQWHDAWRGQVRIAYSSAQAIDIVKMLTTR